MPSPKNQTQVLGKALFHRYYVFQAFADVCPVHEMDTDQKWGPGKFAAADASVSASAEAAAGKFMVELALHMPRSTAECVDLFSRCSGVDRSTAAPDFRRPVYVLACDKCIHSRARRT